VIPSGYAAFQQISHTNAVQRFGGTLRQLLDDEQRREYALLDPLGDARAVNAADVSTPSLQRYRRSAEARGILERRWAGF